MPNIERYAKYEIAKSITSVGNISKAIDYNNPLAYTAWLSYFTDISVSKQTYQNIYNSYLRDWNDVKNTFLNNQDTAVKENYVRLVKDLQLDVLTEQERQFIEAVDYQDPQQLDTLIPLISEKINSLCNYYKNFREVVKTQPRKNNMFSSNLGIRSFLLQTISDLLNYDSDTVDLTNKYNIDTESVLRNISILVEDLYDEYTDYFDLTTQLPSSAYEYGGELRKEEWTSNTNPWDFDLFYKYDDSVVRLLSSYTYILSGFSDNLAVPVGLSAEDIVSYSSTKDYIDNIKTDDVNDLNLANKIKLFQKYLGTDWYMLSTGDTVTNYLSSLLIKADNVSSNYLNRNNVSTATVPNTAFVVSQKDIGGFYTPNYLGVLNYTSFDYTHTVNTSKLSPNEVYFFPDPKKYIATAGNSKYIKTGTCFTVQENAYVVNYDFANSYAFGYINDQGYYLNYHGYENAEEKNRIYNAGISKNYDKVDFFKGKSSNLWANDDVYEVSNKALFPIDERQTNLLAGQKDIIDYSSDVYGNQYGSLKAASDPIFRDIETVYAQIRKRFILLSNFLYEYEGISPFDYTTATGEVTDPYDNIVFNRSGIELLMGHTLADWNLESTDPDYVDLFKDFPSPITLSYGTFTMPWRGDDQLQMLFRKNGLYDGITFTGYQNLPFVDSPLPESTFWSTNNQDLYYNLVLEGGPNINGGRGTVLSPATFMHIIPLSASNAVKDGGRFRYLKGDPFLRSEPNINRHDIPYSSFQKLSTSYVVEASGANASIYAKRYELTSYPYFRNISNEVFPLSSALSAVFVKYKALSAIYDELNDNIIKYDIVYDVGVFETSNYMVLEKINFDYNTNTVKPYTSSLSYIERTDKGSGLEKFGDFYFHERTNSFLLYKTTLLDSLSSSVYKTFYPTIYKYELDSLSLKQVFPTNNTNLFKKLSTYSFRSNGENPDNLEKYIRSLSAVQEETPVYSVDSIDRPNLSYDPNTNNYGFVIKASDNSDALAFYYQTYKYVDGSMINSINEIYFQNGIIRDECYVNPLTAAFLHYNYLPETGKGFSWIKNEGVLKLGE